MASKNVSCGSLTMRERQRERGAALVERVYSAAHLHSCPPACLTACLPAWANSQQTLLLWADFTYHSSLAVGDGWAHTGHSLRSSACGVLLPKRANIILYFKYQLISLRKWGSASARKRDWRVKLNSSRLNWNTQVDDECSLALPEFSANIAALHRSIVGFVGSLPYCCCCCYCWLSGCRLAGVNAS